MRWQLVAFAAALWTGCGSKKVARDCDAYAQQVMALSDPALGRGEPLLASIRDRCARGRVPDREIECVMAATTRAQLITCSTGTPPSPDTSAAPPPAPKGTNAVTLVAVQNAGDFKPVDFALHEDQRTWLEELRKEVATCATDEVYDPPRQYVVVVQLNGATPFVSPGGMPAPLSHCIKRVLSRRPPSSVGNGAVEVLVDVGR